MATCVDLSELRCLVDECGACLRQLAYCPPQRPPASVCHHYLDSLPQPGWSRPHAAALIDQMIREAEPEVQRRVSVMLAVEDERRDHAEMRVMSERSRVAASSPAESSSDRMRPAQAAGQSDREGGTTPLPYDHRDHDLDVIPQHPLSPDHHNRRKAAAQRQPVMEPRGVISETVERRPTGIPGSSASARSQTEGHSGALARGKSTSRARGGRCPASQRWHRSDDNHQTVMSRGRSLVGGRRVASGGRYNTGTGLGRTGIPLGVWIKRQAGAAEHQQRNSGPVAPHPARSVVAQQSAQPRQRDQNKLRGNMGETAVSKLRATQKPQAHSSVSDAGRVVQCGLQHKHKMSTVRFALGSDGQESRRALASREEVAVSQGDLVSYDERRQTHIMPSSRSLRPGDITGSIAGVVSAGLAQDNAAKPGARAHDDVALSASKTQSHYQVGSSDVCKASAVNRSSGVSGCETVAVATSESGPTVVAFLSSGLDGSCDSADSLMTHTDNCPAVTSPQHLRDIEWRTVDECDAATQPCWSGAGTQSPNTRQQQSTVVHDPDEWRGQAADKHAPTHPHIPPLHLSDSEPDVTPTASLLAGLPLPPPLSTRSDDISWSQLGSARCGRSAVSVRDGGWRSAPPRGYRPLAECTEIEAVLTARQRVAKRSACSRRPGSSTSVWSQMRGAPGELERSRDNLSSQHSVQFDAAFQLLREVVESRCVDVVPTSCRTTAHHNQALPVDHINNADQTATTTTNNNNNNNNNVMPQNVCSKAVHERPDASEDPPHTPPSRSSPVPSQHVTESSNSRLLAPAVQELVGQAVDSQDDDVATEDQISEMQQSETVEPTCDLEGSMSAGHRPDTLQVSSAPVSSHHVTQDDEGGVVGVLPGTRHISVCEAGVQTTTPVPNKCQSDSVSRTHTAARHSRAVQCSSSCVREVSPQSRPPTTAGVDVDHSRHIQTTCCVHTQTSPPPASVRPLTTTRSPWSSSSDGGAATRIFAELLLSTSSTTGNTLSPALQSTDSLSEGEVRLPYFIYRRGRRLRSLQQVLWERAGACHSRVGAAYRHERGARRGCWPVRPPSALDRSLLSEPEMAPPSSSTAAAGSTTDDDPWCDRSALEVTEGQWSDAED